MLAELLLAVSLPCTINIDANGNASASCAGTPAPTPAPSPTPPPPAPAPYVPGGTCADVPVVMQPMYMSGAINYVFDSANYTNSGSAIYPSNPGTSAPQGTIQVFELPKTFKDGKPVTHAHITAGDYPLVDNGATFEVAFSRCKGDFSYYKSTQASVTFFGTTYYPCGTVYGPNFSLDWGTQGDLNTCTIPAGETWYLNWRVVPGTCPSSGHTCGHIFNVTG